MKKIRFYLVLCCIAVLVNSKASSQVICKWKASFVISDIRVMGKLETKVLSSLQIDVQNEGTCVWKKNEVYMKAKVHTVPRGADKSDAEASFNTSQKFYLNNDHVTKGGTGRFILKFDQIGVEGMYVLELVVINKAGEEISKPVQYRLKYTD